MNLSFRLSLAVVTMLVPLGLGAQTQPGFKKAAPKQFLAPSAGPVTEAEAVATFQKIGQAVKGVLHVDSPEIAIKPSGRPATREEILGHFDKLFEASRPAFHIAPRKIKFDSGRLTVFAVKPAAEKLIAWGFVAKVGPLVTGSKNQLTLAQFGDAVGLYLSRLAEVTHTPSPKWSPYINKDF